MVLFDLNSGSVYDAECNSHVCSFDVGGHLSMKHSCLRVEGHLIRGDQMEGVLGACSVERKNFDRDYLFY